jgi:hypothetical protein
MKNMLGVLGMMLVVPVTGLGGTPEVEDGFVPAFDALVASGDFQTDLEFDDSSAELDVSRYLVAGFLHKPVGIGGDWKFLSALDAGVTTLDFSDTPKGFAVGDEDLYRTALHGMIYGKPADGRWLYAGWARANLATDFEEVDGDDFYFDVAAGAGYLVTDELMVGLGAAGLRLGNDGMFVGGPFFYWKPTREIDVSLMGALFNAIWRPCDDWALALRVRPSGGSWNIDDAGLSRQVDLRSFSARLHLERRIWDELWLSVGVGYSFANQLELRTTGGGELFKDDLGGGLSTSVALRLRRW